MSSGAFYNGWKEMLYPEEQSPLLPDDGTHESLSSILGIEDGANNPDPLWEQPNMQLGNEDYAPPPMAQVEFLNLTDGRLFEKVQSRKGGKPRQVLEDAVIEMRATYGPYDLLKIRGWIRRDPEAAKLFNDENQEVLLIDGLGQELNLAQDTHGLDIVSDEPRKLSQTFSVDLGKVYDGPTQPVFKLAKNDTAARNRFQLLIQLEFPLGQCSDVFVSPTFLCRTKLTKKRKSDETSLQGPSPKNQNTDAPSTNASTDDTSMLEPGPSPASPNIEPPSVKNTGTSGSLILDSLNAHTATIEHLNVTGTWSGTTPNRDIAYHLKIEDPEMCNELEEGDIIGFYTDENDGGTYIKRLCNSNIENAVHAGVISRSYYLAANKPSEPEVPTDTVCVIGIVDVKVVGSVENGERIYASVDYPGKAIPQSHLPVGSFLRKKHVLLGMALERKHSKFLQDSQLVKCFVCIVLDVNRKELLEEVEELYESTERSTQEMIKIASRKTWKRLRICFILFFTFVGLLSFMLYQLLVPGSMFRYWLCRRGSIGGHNVYFSFIPYKDITTRYNVHGILFDYKKVLDKIPEKVPENNRSDTGGTAYYYLNLDRCAFSGDEGHVGNYIGGHKSIRGGLILSVNWNCSIVYYYGNNKDLTRSTWRKYISAKRLRCIPRPPFK